MPVDPGTVKASSLYVSPDGHEFFELISTYLPLQDQYRVRDAFEITRLEHGDQRRQTGELFFTHPLPVA